MDHETCFSRVLIPFDRREALSLKAAADIAGRSMRTIRRWCVEHGIGRVVGGRWVISIVALYMFIEGADEALRCYRDFGAREYEPVAAYFRRLGLGALLTPSGAVAA